MKRRPFLHLAAATVTSAGCLGAGDSPSALSDAPASKTDADGVAASHGGTRPNDASLAVESVDTFEYVVRLNDLGDDPSGSVTAFADLSDRERRIVETAIAGRYRTPDSPQWLVRFASATPVVERRGVFYRLGNTFPTCRITAESVAADDVRGRIATYEEYERAVTHDGYELTSLLRVARRDGIELTYVWPGLRQFLDAYDAVRYRGDLLSFSVAVADSGPPYELSASRIPVSEAVDGSVWDANDASAETRELLEKAGRASGAYGFDRAPTGFLDALRSHEYAYLDGTFYATYVEKRESVAVSVSAALRNGRLRLALRNVGDRELVLSSGPPRPFGVLHCHPKGNSGTDRLLWTDAYAESDHVRTAGREVRSVADVALVSTVAPDETVGETYAVPDLPTGEAVLPNSVEVERDAGDGGGSTVRFRVVLSVE